VDKKEIGSFYHRRPDAPPHVFHPWEINHSHHESDDDFEDDDFLDIGLFGTQERAMFMEEVLQQVVIGMGRLDVGVEEENIDPVDEQPSLKARDTDRLNSYFPSMSTNFPPTSSFSFHPWSSSTESTPLASRNMGPINNVSPGTEFPPLPSIPRSRSPIGLDSTIKVNW
jgi:serine/threonine-protein phosphatase 4 regulatory subunit 1